MAIFLLPCDKMRSEDFSSATQNADEKSSLLQMTLTEQTKTLCELPKKPKLL
jgi:hypothetical protein